MAFLADLEFRPLAQDPFGAAFVARGYSLGHGPNALEVVVAQTPRQPRLSELRDAWKKRSGGRPTPVLIVACHAAEAKVALCGPVGLGRNNRPPAYLNLPADQTERICRAALAAADRHAAVRLLQETLPEVGDRILGVINQGLLATHEAGTWRQTPLRLARRPKWPRPVAATPARANPPARPRLPDSDSARSGIGAAG